MDSTLRSSLPLSPASTSTSQKLSRDLKCSSCEKTFRRREHLERHTQSHAGLKWFKCHLCPKTFSRRDSLQRHLRVHGSHAVQSLKSGRAAHACHACAREKRRCNGELPCSRCIEKKRCCSYESAPSPTRFLGDSSAQRLPFSSRNFHNDQANTSSPGETPELPLSSTQNISATDVPPLPEISPPLDESMTCSPLSPNESHHPTFFPAPASDQELLWDDHSQLCDLSNSLPDLASLLPWMHQNEDYICPALNLLSPGAYDQEASSSATDTNNPSMLSTPLDPSTVYDPAPGPADRPIDRQRPLPSFPPTQLSDHDILAAENFAHVSPITDHIYYQICSFHKQQREPGCGGYAFPEKAVFNTFIQLYFEYFDPQMPFLHRSLVEREDAHWILVLAVATTGSQYTSIPSKAQYIIGLLELLRRALPTDAITAMKYDITMLAQSGLLCCVCLMFSGFRDYVLILQPQRAWLATLIRPFMSTSCHTVSSISPQRNDVDEGRGDWQEWIRAEERRRLVHCTWMFDCILFILLDMQPVLRVDDYDLGLPQDDALWRAKQPGEWEAHYLMQSASKFSKISLNTSFTKFCLSEVDPLQLPQRINLLLIVTFWVEERKALRGHRALSTLHGKSKHQESPSDRGLDARFSELQPVRSSDTPRPNTIFYNILFILRQIPLDILYTYSGWHSSPDEIKKARDFSSRWMRANRSHARQCLILATATFNQIRGAASATYYHPFFLLISAQFILIYIQEVHIPHFSEYQQGFSQALHQVPLLRANRIGASEESLVSSWVAGDTDIDIFLTGVGRLSEPRAPVCLLRELRRLYDSEAVPGWPTLRRGISVNVEESVNGTPLTNPPYSVAVEAEVGSIPGAQNNPI